MSDLIEEAHLDYKEEQKMKYFKKALPFVIGGTIVVIIVMTIMNWMNNRKIAHNQEMGDLFIKVLQTHSGDHKLLDDALSMLIKETDNGMGDLAAIEKVKLRIMAKDIKGALAELEVVASKAHKPIVKSYAMLLWMNIMIDHDSFTEGDKLKMHKYFVHFDNSEIPFYGSATIIKALFEIKNNQIDLAKITLNKLIVTDDITSTVRDQARSILTNLDS